jgi:hypothetical protein
MNFSVLKNFGNAKSYSAAYVVWILALTLLFIVWCGSPLVDFAFFLYTSVKNQDLRNYEIELMKFFFSCISFYGIYDSSLEECFEDYFHTYVLRY